MIMGIDGFFPVSWIIFVIFMGMIWLVLMSLLGAKKP